ncbi:hypothetical protein D9Q98_006914 [Chlorella vulgaris]|uniref:SGNH hydrolase-type esterase domain-containing protein n=1 Tax=Chlorella vulgaris TaxID=3077 RepID=A0A9D4TJ28_CHLVU|nr:hypothetical protein D9Q98_006914 [Chlorella vulgaris]
MLQKGVVSHGDMARMRRFLHKLLTGQAVTVVVIGGSVAWGHGSSEQGVTDFAARFFEWLTATFPNPDHQFLNRAISATPSTYFSLCLQWHVPPEADFVLLEFNPNDGADKGDAPSRRGHERLIRKLLVHRNLPPLIEVVFMHWGLDWAEHAEIPYRMGGDDEIAVLAQYYNLPWVSSRSLLWDTVYDSKGRANFTAEEPWPYFHVDRNHPNDVGHMYIAEMVVLHMRRVLEDLHHRPYNAADEAVSSAPLRPPMLRNNWPSQNNSCLVGKLFKQQVVAAKGFEWVNEGTQDKPKWGYVGKHPNATLRFTVNTATATAAASTEGGVAIDVTQIPTHVGVLYLRSYQGMGMFELSCVAGCTCEPFKLDGWMEFKASQEYHAAWPVSRSEKCVIEARILNETTTSGDHKAKLTGVIVSEVAGQHLEVYANRIHVDFNDDSGVGEFEW